MSDETHEEATLVETSDVHYTLTNDLLLGSTTVPGASLTDVLSNTTLAQLHTILQILFAWSDEQRIGNIHEALRLRPAP